MVKWSMNSYNQDPDYALNLLPLVTSKKCDEYFASHETIGS